MKNDDITYERVYELFDYDEEKGVLILRDTNKTAFIRMSSKSTGRKRIRVDKGRYSSHILIWLWHNKELPSRRIIFLDGDESNTSIHNLSLRPLQPLVDKKSHVIGVNWHKHSSLWRASILSECLGYVEDYIECIYLRLAAEQCLDAKVTIKHVTNRISASEFIKWQALTSDINVFISAEESGEISSLDAGTKIHEKIAEELSLDEDRNQSIIDTLLISSENPDEIVTPTMVFNQKTPDISDNACEDVHEGTICDSDDEDVKSSLAELNDILDNGDNNG